MYGLTLLALLPCLLAFPTVTKRADNQLISAGRDGLCLSLQGGKGTAASNGVPVVSLPCDQASTWSISPGSGSVIVSGTNFALDAGSNPGNNGALKVWTSYPGLYQQTWYLTDDKRIAITGGNQCLDEGTNGVQTYQCTTGNTNQVWNVRGSSGPAPSSVVVPPKSSSVAPPKSSSSSAVSTPSQSSTPSTGGKRIYWNGDKTKCLTVGNGYAGVGTQVQIVGCFSDSDPFASLQKWTFNPSAPGAITVTGANSNTPLCLDAGNNPSNGSGMKIYTCYPGLLQQTWSFNGNGLASLSNGQCLNVRAESGPGFNKPYGSLKDTQTWACSSSDPNEKFTT